MALTTPGQWGPEALIDRAGNALIPTTVTVPVGYTGTVDVLGNLTVVGPPSDSVAVSVTAPDGTVTEYTLRVPAAATELHALEDRVDTVEAGGGGGSAPLATTTSMGTITLAGDLSGTAAAPTVPELAGKATPADISAAIAALVDSSPATLDTLNELAAALGDDPNFATTMTTALAGKAGRDFDFVAGREYVQGELAVQAGVVYSRNVTGTPASFVAEEWTAVGGAGPDVPTGAFLVYGTNDQAVIDANPTLTFLLFQSAPADTAAPTAPTMTATAGNGQVALTASGSTDDTAVTGYRFFRDTVLIADQASASYTDIGLTNGTSYSYTASAYDAAGNVSALSAAVTATPTAVVTTLTADTFDRADSTTSLGTASDGKVWTALVGTFGISANQAYAPVGAATGNPSLAVLPVTGEDYELTATIGTLGNTTGRGIGVIARAVDASNYVWADFDPVNRWLRFATRVAGVNTVLFTSANNTVSLGSVIGIRAVGSTFELLHNDVVLHTATEAALATGDVGLRYNPTAVETASAAAKIGEITVTSP